LPNDDVIWLGVESIDLIGALVAVLIYVGCILIFLARLAGKPAIEHWIGLCLTLAVIPLTYLLLAGGEYAKPPLYSVQLVLMIVFLLVAFVLDYVMRYEFRRVRWVLIPYVVLFFAATGGMIGVAGAAGPGWTYAAIALFLATGTLAFVQRAKTGL
jgi:hypothetical protein